MVAARVRRDLETTNKGKATEKSQFTVRGAIPETGGGGGGEGLALLNVRQQSGKQNIKQEKVTAFKSSVAILQYIDLRFCCCEAGR